MVQNIKVAVCGSGAVGKSCLTIQFVQNQFVEAWDPTIEDSYQKTLKINNDVVQLDILDTAGQGLWYALRDEYMRTADGFLLVFDISKPKTFEDLNEFHKQIVRSKDCDYPPIVLVGNKIDLPPEKRTVSKQQSEELCSKWKIEFIETSAKTRTNVDEAFQKLVKFVLRDLEKTKPPQPTTTQKEKKSCILL
ncbi:ras family small GTPase [Naegleria gruberi]|uniref:small monomeric GTPase n=1 Tax=Naegleria gruberi TaxID=5762 RepID=D2VIW8_NAEGR|nr:ras family small GTPase [Naegleria gruberi]EFC43098.1 ras family small GTPase [Naegleria gruberi]|eukprot:XP_002675842.1 ras family small GTPase [Naegleria gruberi strain NEG-M]